MALAVMLIMTLAVLLSAYGILRGVHWCRTPRELRGDWWSRFERQYRAYVTAVHVDSEWSGRERRHHPR